LSRNKTILDVVAVVVDVVDVVVVVAVVVVASYCCVSVVEYGNIVAT
jgi:hypothetical protein